MDSPLTPGFLTSLHTSLSRLDPSFPLSLPLPDSPSLQHYLASACTRLLELLDQKQEQSGLNKLIRTLQADRTRLEEENEELREEVDRLQRDSEDEATENGDNLTRLLMVNVLKKTLESKELMFEQKEREMKRVIREKEAEVSSCAVALAQESAKNVRPVTCEIALQTLSALVKDSETHMDAVEIAWKEAQTEIEGEGKGCQTDLEPEISEEWVQTEWRSALAETQTDSQSDYTQKEVQTDPIPELIQASMQTDPKNEHIETQTAPNPICICREMQTDNELGRFQAETQTQIAVIEACSQTNVLLSAVETQCEVLEAKENWVQTAAKQCIIHLKTTNLAIEGEIIDRNSAEVQTCSDPTLCAAEIYVQTELDLESQWIQTEATEGKEALVQTSIDFPEENLLIVPEITSICVQTDYLQETLSTQTDISVWMQADAEVLVKPITTTQKTGTDHEFPLHSFSTQTEFKGDGRWTQTETSLKRDAFMQFRPIGLDKQVEADIQSDRLQPEKLPKSLVFPRQTRAQFLLLRPTPKTTKNSAAQTPFEDSAQHAFSLKSIAISPQPYPHSKQPPTTQLRIATSLPLSPKDPELRFSLQDAEEQFIFTQKTVLNKTENSDLSAWETQLQAKESTLLSLTQQLRQRERITLEREQRLRRRKLFEAGAVTQLHPAAAQRRETDKSLTDR